MQSKRSLWLAEPIQVEQDAKSKKFALTLESSRLKTQLQWADDAGRFRLIEL